jgi:hypothetical protein
VPSKHASSWWPIVNAGESLIAEKNETPVPQQCTGFPNLQLLALPQYEQTGGNREESKSLYVVFCFNRCIG